jgi:8-oxo-dGTP pyrophosphatase MutT (NUDIX family)
MEVAPEVSNFARSRRSLDLRREFGIVAWMGRFVVAVAVVIVRGDRVLAMRRAAARDVGAGLWETISGRLEEDEQPLEGVAREMAEECGLGARISPRPVDAYAMRRGAEPMFVVVYRADWVAGEVALSSEHDAHAWWTLAEVEASAMPTRLVEAVRRALAP